MNGEQFRRGDWVMLPATGDVFVVGSDPYWAHDAWRCLGRAWYPKPGRTGGLYEMCLAKMRPTDRPGGAPDIYRSPNLREKDEPMASPWGVTAKNGGGGDYESPPDGNHPAVLVALVDLGTHEDEYQGQRSENRKVLLAWELTAEHKADGSPFVVAKEFNLLSRMSQKSGLRLMLESWRGKPLGDAENVDLQSLLGKACAINVGSSTTTKGNTFSKILNIAPIMRGLAVPKPLCEPFEWHFGAGPFRAPDWLPYLYGKPIEDWIAAAKESRGYANGPAPAPDQPVGAGVGAASPDADDPDVPF